MPEKDMPDRSDNDDEIPDIQLSAREPLPLPPEIHYTRPTSESANSANQSSQAANHGAGLAAGGVLVAGVIGGALLGSWIDQRWNHSSMPWATLILTLIGTAVGFLNLQRLLARTNRNQK